MIAPLNLVKTGNGNHPVVFLHGFLGSHKDWESIIQLLPDCTCYSIDLPGHGESLPTDDAAYTMHGMADLVLQTLDAHDVKKATLVGYSMGGRLALYLALRNPTRWSHLLVESASPGIKSVIDRHGRYLNDLKWAREMEVDFSKFVDHWYAQPIFSSLAQNEGLLAKKKSNVLAQDPKFLARCLRVMTVGRQLPMWGRLADCSLPVSLVTGAKDEKYGEILDRMSESLPGSSIHKVKGVGHNVHLEAPEHFVDILCDFIGLQKAPARRRACARPTASTK